MGKQFEVKGSVLKKMIAEDFGVLHHPKVTSVKDLVSTDTQYISHAAGSFALKIVDDWVQYRSADPAQIDLMKQALDQTGTIAVGNHDSENARFSAAWVPEGGTAVTGYRIFHKAKGLRKVIKFTVLMGDNEYEVIQEPEPLSFTIRGVQGVGDPDCPILMTTQSGYAALSAGLANKLATPNRSGGNDTMVSMLSELVFLYAACFCCD